MIHSIKILVLRIVSTLKQLLAKYRKWNIREMELSNDLHPPQTILRETTKHTFFGYYDINPFNSAENRLLGCTVMPGLKTPEAGSIMEIGYFNLNESSPRFIKVGETESWNWQQGCRLRWYPSELNNLISFNILVEDHYGAIIQNMQNGSVVHKIDYPIYDLDPLGKFGISLNFSRLHRLRPGYGYNCLPDNSIDDNCPDNDGVWLVNIIDNRRHLLYSLKFLSSIFPHDSMINAVHYINHLSFSPNGESFMFFHLWLDQNKKRYSRLFTSKTEGGELNLVNNIGHVSHYTWLSNEIFVITSNISLKQLRYLKYHIKTGFMGIIGVNHLTEDGHPTFLKDGISVITDTYPDTYKEQKLMIYNHYKGLIILDRYYSPSEFTGEFRCDLHPRLSQSGQKVCIDVVENGFKAMRILQLKQVIDLNLK